MQKSEKKLLACGGVCDHPKNLNDVLDSFSTDLELNLSNENIKINKQNLLL